MQSLKRTLETSNNLHLSKSDTHEIQEQVGKRINYKGSYGFCETLKRFFNPCYRNAQDLKTVDLMLNHLEKLANAVPATEKGLTAEVEKELSKCNTLIKRLSKQWFVSKNVVQGRHQLEYYFLAGKIAQMENLPFKALAQDFELVNFIKSNHLQHKITAQHKAEEIQITADEEGQLLFPVDYDRFTELFLFRDFKEHFKENYDPTYVKVKDLECMANGLEIHSAKKWQVLRPSYATSIENGTLVHIDTLTRQKEVIGNEGDDYVQLVNIYPWGWNPRGGSLLGHTYVRFVINGDLYHVGMNLQGELLNPDFMSTMPMKDKKFKTTEWRVMDKTADEHGNTQARRTLLKLQLMQDLLNNRLPPQNDPYLEETQKLYNDIRTKKGGTCTAGALAFYKQFDVEVNENESRNLLSRIVFNSVVRRVLDFTWSLFPNCMRTRVIQPIQVITRAPKPMYVH